MYAGASSSAGVYSISDLPVGAYAVTARAQGFKTYTHTNLAPRGHANFAGRHQAGSGRSRRVGDSHRRSDLLATQTGELTHNITLQQMDDLPLLGIGTTNAGATAIRNPFNAIEALPGLSAYNPGYGFTFNGQTTAARSASKARIERRTRWVIK